MEASQGSFGRTCRVVDLHETGGEPLRGEFLLAEHSGEETAFVASPFELDQVGTRKRGFVEDHWPVPLPSCGCGSLGGPVEQLAGRSQNTLRRIFRGLRVRDCGFALEWNRAGTGKLTL